MMLHFTKMHGLGNDFVILDGINQLLTLTKDQIRFIADRHFGIGCDQLLVVESPQQSNVDFRYRIYNADGGEVEQCGNGARCFAHFVYHKKLTEKTTITAETSAGILELQLKDNAKVTVNMGIPILQPSAIPFIADHEQPTYSLETENETLTIGVVSMGNPHTVLTVADVESAPVHELGPLIAANARFPMQVNVGFMQRKNQHHIALRVFERGVGETLACGSGACAAVVVGRLQNALDEQVLVDLPGGSLEINWRGPGQPVWMTGPATHVFEGKIEL